MDDGDKYIPNGVWLRCDKGTLPRQLTILPKTVKLYGQDWAGHLDAVPMVNIPTFGVCAIIKACVPATVMWTGAQNDVSMMGQSPILDTSTCQCMVGGRIKIYFTKQAATDAGAEQEAKEDADFWGKVGMGLLVAGAIVGTAAIIVASGGTALAVLGAAAATGAAVGGVAGAVQGGITGGAEGAASGFLMGAGLGALGGIAAVGAPLIAGAAAVAGLASVGYLGKAFYHNPSNENGLVLVGAIAATVAGGLTGGGIRAISRPRTSTVYRAQGGVLPNASQHRVAVDARGNASISGRTMVHVGIDNKNHAVYFYNKRGGANAGAEIVSFKIPKSVADQIRREAIPQIDGKKFPNSPQIDDPTVGPGLYGLPKAWIDRLNREAIPGSGRITKPTQK